MNPKSFYVMKWNPMLLALFCMLPALIFAQTVPVHVSGETKDASGLLLPGQPVVLLFTGANGFELDSTMSNPAGSFTFGTKQMASPSVVYLQGACAGGGVVDTFFINGPDSLFSTLTCPAAGSGCDATFSGSPTGGGGYAFQFSGNNGPNAIYTLDMGNGQVQTLTGANVFVGFYSPGTYTACLTVQDQGCADSSCISVVIQPSTAGCNANFFIFPGATPFSRSFVVDTSNFNPNLNYFWDFGDGSTSTANFSTSHTYSQTGTYNVCLVVEDTFANCADTVCQSVQIINTPVPCQADFTYGQSAGGIFFQNLSTSSAPLNYQWDFGDGNSSTAMNPFHTYSAPGTYQVCLIASTGTGCADTTCKSVTVNLPGGGNCVASIIATLNPSGTWVFEADSASPTNQYFWDFGDGTNGIGPVVTKTYSTLDTFTVCLLVTDSLLSCADTACITVIGVGMAPSCQAFFTYSSSANGLTYQFTDSSVSQTGAITSWLWEFGDSTTSTLQNPTHTYSTVAPWPVCLTITDTSGCSATYCDLVLPMNAPNTYFVAGLVATDSMLGTQSMVYLIQHDSVANTLTGIDSMFSVNGLYHFANVSPGSYLVKAGLTPASQVYSQYLPTYLGDVMLWSQATATIVTNQDVFNPPIHLTAGANPGGPAFIGGLISQGANKNGDPLPNISVILMTHDQQPVTHTLTNQDGEYAFTNLAYGTYRVHVEVPGKVAEQWVVTLDANNPSFELGDFAVHTDHIDAIGTTSLAGQLDPGTLRLYPNPTSGTAQIELNLPQAGGELRLINHLGATIATREFQQAKWQTEFDLSGLANGVYLIQVTTTNGTLTRQLLKR